MLFVLNTGRAGSRTVANVLSQHPELVSTHEPLPRLIEETAEYRYGRYPAERLAALLAESRPASIDGRRYCETANRLSLAVPVLAETFPDAQFLWLVRDGRDVVSSGMQRGWFDPSVVKDTPWERHRLRGDELGEVDPAEWADWSPFRRVSWLWRRTNEIIDADLSALEPDRSMLVRLEELPARMDDIARFLDIEPIDWIVPRQNARATRPDTGPSTANQVDRRFEFADWTEEQIEDFRRECGELMDVLYPYWQTEPAAPTLVSLDEHRLRATQVDVADLKVMRAELALLTTHALRVDRRLVESRSLHAREVEKHAKQLARIGELQKELRSADRRMSGLEKARDEADSARVHAESEIVRLETVLAEATSRAERAQSELRKTRASTSFRLGHRVVRSLVRPVRFLRSVRRRLGLAPRTTPSKPAPAGRPVAETAGADVPDVVSITPPGGVGFGDLDRLDPAALAEGSLTSFRMTIDDASEIGPRLDAAVRALGEEGEGRLILPSDAAPEHVAAVLGAVERHGLAMRLDAEDAGLALVVERGIPAAQPLADAVSQASVVAADLARARSEARRLAKELEAQKRSAEKRLAKAQDSTQYRIGATMLEVYHNPLRALKIPREVAALQRRRARPAPHSATPDDIEPELDLKVVSILDEFTHDCFAPEFDLVPADRNDWRAQLDGAGLVFVESAWRGNGGTWNYTLNKFDRNGDDVRGLLDEARRAGIPSVFWNKEDPVSFDVFLPAAGAFDAILTTDRDMVDDYRHRVGHDRVLDLPFAAQPRLHNPIGRPRGADVAGRVCFAGSWRGDKYQQRGSDFDTLLGPPLERGALDIYDRYANGPDAEKLGFPEPFRSAVVGSLPYSEIGVAYRRYAAFLNVNSVQDSPTMFSRRVFELLACGTPVISTPAKGIDEMLGDAVLVTRSREETAAHVDWALHEPEARDRHAHLGYRLVHREHSYERRVDRLLAHAGVEVGRPAKRVSVICVSNRPEMTDHAIDSYLRQTYADKEFVFVANSSGFDSALLASVEARVPGARVMQIDEAATLGQCLNDALRVATGQYFAKFDDDDHYGDEYLADLMMTFPYSGAAVAGKQCYYAYLESQDRTVLRFPGREFRTAPRVVGGTIVADRAQVDGIAFESVPRGSDSRFLEAVRSRGLTVFSADRYNFCQVRHADVAAHTWSIDDEEFLKACVDVGGGLRRDEIFF